MIFFDKNAFSMPNLGWARLSKGKKKNPIGMLTCRDRAPQGYSPPQRLKVPILKMGGGYQLSENMLKVKLSQMNGEKINLLTNVQSLYPCLST